MYFYIALHLTSVIFIGNMQLFAVLSFMLISVSISPSTSTSTFSLLSAADLEWVVVDSTTTSAVSTVVVSSVDVSTFTSIASESVVVGAACFFLSASLIEFD